MFNFTCSKLLWSDICFIYCMFMKGTPITISICFEHNNVCVNRWKKRAEHCNLSSDELFKTIYFSPSTFYSLCSIHDCTLLEPVSAYCGQGQVSSWTGQVSHRTDWPCDRLHMQKTIWKIAEYMQQGAYDCFKSQIYYLLYNVNYLLYRQHI